MLRNQPSNRHEDDEPGPLASVVNGLLTLGYFLLLPIILLVIIDWVAYSVFKDTFYGEHWMMPVLVAGVAFLSGAFMRQKAADDAAGIGTLVMAMLALAVFAYLTWLDVTSSGGYYSRFLPQIMRSEVQDYVFLLPPIGLIWMLFYKQFSLKNYD